MDQNITILISILGWVSTPLINESIATDQRPMLTKYHFLPVHCIVTSFYEHINKTRNAVTMHWLEKVLSVHWSLASSNNTVHKYITLNFTAKGI